MATVELSFTPLPAHVRTARLVAAAVARRSGVDESLLDEVRLAVGEACSRAVEEHRLHCPTEPVRLALTELSGRFEVEVTDNSAQAGGADGGTAPAFPPGFGIAVIAGLADDVQISETAAGTSIRMSWPSTVPVS
jgi:serine/threonine-protein kinase RsbW